MVTSRRALLAVAAVGLALLLAACSGGSESDPNTIVVGDDRPIEPVIATSELVVGPNRFVLGVFDKDQRAIVDAKVHLTFFELTATTATPKFEADAISRVPARDAGITEEIVHAHADGTKHTHLNVGEDLGVYTANVTFDKPGDWGVEVAVDSENPKLTESERVRFNVIDQSVTPAIGSAAPKSRNLTAADVADITEIDSSSSPMPEFHESTIADTIDAGRPALVLFAVPGFCSSQLCGPEYEIMKKLYPKYNSNVEFIHVEFYKDPGNPAFVPNEAVLEWNLRTEPWFFVIDSNGIVAAKFEGPAALSELDEALQKVVAGAR